jgi:hypothetical protein
MLYRGHVTLFAEALELFMRAMFHLLVIQKMVSSEGIFQGPKKVEVCGC